MKIGVAIFLGFIQGITEFLPVSSSGHLVILQSLFKLKEENLFFDTVLHLGTALAVLVVFKDDIIKLIVNVFRREKKSIVYFLYVIIATIPAAFLGALFNDFFEELFTNTTVVGAMLVVTSILLFTSTIRKTNMGEVTLWKAIVIGIAQAVAIVPGISRSGSTITTALLVGVTREEAGRFSFILALPVILGAAVLQSVKIERIDVGILPLVVGFVVSFVTGIISLKLLLKFVKGGKFYIFGFYCLTVGILTLIFL